VSENNSLIKKMMLGIMGLIVIAVIAFFVIKPILIKKHLPQPVIINTDNQPTIGAAKATVHIVAFEDLKCSNCARFNKELMPYIRKHFIDTGIATYTMINLAFIDGSMPAANAAHCVYKQNSTLFFDYTDYIFEHQPPETENWATIPTLLNFANKVKGINTQQLAQCLIKSPYDQLVHANLTQAMQLMNGNVATPTLYINGIIVTPLTKSQINKIVEVVK